MGIRALRVGVSIGSLTDFNVLEPVISELLRAGSPVSIHTRNDTRPLDVFSDDRLVRVIGEVDLFDSISSSAIDVLLLANDFIHPLHELGNRVTGWARLHGIPSVSVQHGFFSEVDNPFHYVSFTADVMAVWSDFFRTVLVGKGRINPKRLVVTGNPAFDCIAGDDRGALRETLCGQFSGGDSGKPIVLVAMATHHLMANLGFEVGKTTAYLSGIVGGAVGSGARVVVKPHPHEGAGEYHAPYAHVIRVYGDGQDVRLADARENIGGLVAASDLLVTHASSTAYEALVRGIPAMSVRLPGMRSDLRALEGASSQFLSGECDLDQVAAFVARGISQLLDSRRAPQTQAPWLARDMQRAIRGEAAQKVALLCTDAPRRERFVEARRTGLLHRARRALAR